MPGRKYRQVNTTYRYGFNGKENDSDVKGEGNQQDYGARIYDTRLGRFLSVDPLTRAFSWYSPFQFAGNMPIAAVDLDGEEQKIMINWYDVNGNVTSTKLVKADFNAVNKLYQSLSKGLNSETTYTLEGTKFNSTNAQFSSGFEAYKKGSPTRTPNGRIRPNNGLLKFDITIDANSKESVKINFDNVPINEKELFIDAFRGASKVASFVGDRIEETGYGVTAIPGLQEIGVPMIAIGKGVSLGGDIGDLGADLLERKTKDFAVKGAVVAFEAVAGRAIGKTPIKKLGKEAIDSYVGRGGGAIRDGYSDNRTQTIEESDKLDLKIETKKN